MVKGAQDARLEPLVDVFIYNSNIYIQLVYESKKRKAREPAIFGLAKMPAECRTLLQPWLLHF